VLIAMTLLLPVTGMLSLLIKLKLLNMLQQSNIILVLTLVQLAGKPLVNIQQQGAAPRYRQLFIQLNSLAADYLGGGFIRGQHFTKAR
jgi:hypothetical protein